MVIDFSILLLAIVELDKVHCNHLIGSYCNYYDFQNYCYDSLYFGILISWYNSTNLYFTKDKMAMVIQSCNFAVVKEYLHMWDRMVMKYSNLLVGTK